MMAASPEFYKPCHTPAFSPLPAAPVVPDDDCYSSCRTPTGSYLREPTTCPPAPRKAPPPPCKKRLFRQQGDDVPLISLRLDELHTIFRPHHPQQQPADKRRRSAARHQRKPLQA